MAQVSGYYMDDPNYMRSKVGQKITMVYKTQSDAMRNYGSIQRGWNLFKVSGKLSSDDGSSLTLYLENYSVVS